MLNFIGFKLVKYSVNVFLGIIKTKLFTIKTLYFAPQQTVTFKYASTKFMSNKPAISFYQ